MGDPSLTIKFIHHSSFIIYHLLRPVGAFFERPRATAGRPYGFNCCFNILPVAEHSILTKKAEKHSFSAFSFIQLDPILTLSSRVLRGRLRERRRGRRYPLSCYTPKGSRARSNLPLPPEDQTRRARRSGPWRATSRLSRSRRKFRLPKENAASSRSLCAEE